MTKTMLALEVTRGDDDSILAVRCHTPRGVAACERVRNVGWESSASWLPGTKACSASMANAVCWLVEVSARASSPEVPAVAVTDRERRILDHALTFLSSNLDDDDVADVNGTEVPVGEVDCAEAHRALEAEIHALHEKVTTR